MALWLIGNHSHENSIKGMSNLACHVKKIIMGDGKEIYSTHIETFAAPAVQRIE